MNRMRILAVMVLATIGAMPSSGTTQPTDHERVLRRAVQAIRQDLPSGPIRLDTSTHEEYRSPDHEVTRRVGRGIGAVLTTRDIVINESCTIEVGCDFKGALISLTEPHIDEDRAVVALHAYFTNQSREVVLYSYEIEVPRNGTGGWEKGRILSRATSH